MDKQPNYFFLSGLFFIGFIVIQFTDIYGDSSWFKVFLLIAFVSFLVGGFLKKKNRIK
mgnify:CR=1 FL=1